MENEEKMLSRIPYLVAENNREELIAIREIVGGCNRELNKAIEDVCEVKRNEEEMRRRYFSQIRVLFKDGKVREANELCDEYLEKAPFSHRPWLLKLYLDANGKMTYVDDGGSVEETGKKIVRQEGYNRYGRNKDNEKMYRIYLATGDYQKARALCYEQGEQAIKEKNYAEAEKYFRKAVNYKDAEEMAGKVCKAPAEYERFKNEVPENYIDEKVRQNHSSLISSLASKRRASNGAPCDYGVFCVICFLAAFALSLYTHWDRDLKTYIVYIIFTIVASIGIHKLFDLDAELVPSGIITFVCLAAPKVLQLVSLKLFNTPTVGFVILNVIFGAAALFTLVKQIRAIPGNKAQKEAEMLMTQLHREVSKYKDELIKQYSSQVGKEIAKTWVDELKVSYH